QMSGIFQHPPGAEARSFLPADLGPLLAALLLGSDGLAVTPLVTASPEAVPARHCRGRRFTPLRVMPCGLVQAG
ncbi:MAG TPA: hypothetical protein VFN75_05135, partial [Pseudonocardiaceae bacterium]|nr:hypothetical protein [Pseudonocardiaceae bacterium]